MRTAIRILAAAGALALTAGPAAALTSQTANFQVTATVNQSCTIAAGNILFGTYTANTQATQQATVTVNCVNGVPYTLTLNNGANYDAANSTRRMLSGVSNYIPYQIYTDAAYANVWNASSGANINSGTGNALNNQFTMYARTSAVAAPTAGSYTDNMVASVNY